MDGFRVHDRSENDRRVHDGRGKRPNCGPPTVQLAPSIENRPEDVGAAPPSSPEENPSEKR